MELNQSPEERGRRALDREFKRFEALIGAEQDAVAVVLRSHLYTEHLLERFLIANLPRGDRVRDKARLSYIQKLAISDSLDIIPDSIITALRHLNSVRNACAHQLEKEITREDLDRIGSPLGGELKTLKAISRDTGLDLLKSLMCHICGVLGGIVCGREDIQSL